MPAQQPKIMPRQAPPKPGQAAALNAQLQHTAEVAAQYAPPAPTEPQEIFPEVTEAFGFERKATGDAFSVPSDSDFEVPPEARNLKPGESATPAVVSSQRKDMVMQPDAEPSMKPPSTRREWQAQQRGDVDIYPDVADVFLGKIPGEVPISGIIKDVAPNRPKVMPPVTPPPVEVVVKHEIDNQAQAYQFTRKYSAFIGSSFQDFAKGDIVYDQTVIDTLLEGGCDALVPHEIAENFISCPNCKHAGPPHVFGVR